MKKNLLNSVAVAAMSLLALACAKEQVTGDGQTVEATFEVDVPGVEVSTKGLSDAAAVDELVFDAFGNIADTEPIKGLRQVVAVVNGRATIQVKLIKGQNYRFVFWAQKSNNGYYNTDNLSNITIDYSNALANDSSLDAFFAREDVTNVQNPISKTITLKRPFAQVNYVTKEDLGEGLYIKESQITVKNALTSFYPLENKFSGEQDVTFKFNAVPTEKLLINGTEYNYLATAFILAKKDNSNDIVDVEAKFKANKGYSVTVSTPGLPCRRNYRTNVIGDFMTVEGAYNIEIDSDFNGDFQEDYIDIANALSSGQDVTLAENYLLDEGNPGVTVNIGKTSVLNLNGKKFSNENAVTTNKAALQVHGDLTINGDGEVYCAGGADNNAIIVEQGGKLVINGGTYNVGKDKNGKSNATIYVNGPDHYGRNGFVEINGGVFMNEEGSNGHAFVLNQNDDITVNCFSVKGGTFVGFNPASVNEAHGAITSFVADGYKSVETTYDGKQAWKVEKITAITPDGLDEALAAVGEGETVELYLGAGEFSFAKSNCKGSIVVKGTSKTETIVSVPNNSRCFDNKSISFENVTLKCSNDYIDDAREAQFPRTDVSFVNCKIEGTFATIGSVVASFKGCEFAAGSTGNAQYAIKYYGGDASSKLVLDDCTFNTYGKCILMFNEAANTYDASISGCAFNASETVTGKAAIQMHTESGIKGKLTISDYTVSGFDTTINGGLWNEINNNTKVHTTKFTVVVNGTTVQSAE